ncbi:hypothetical protein C8T65DRAFT_745739 [Cerioporus squamosus]|nr:hypothetical protein C8T65DRAFT_745739 [Cerioporus squamosus]
MSVVPLEQATAASFIAVDDALCVVNEADDQVGEQRGRLETAVAAMQENLSLIGEEDQWASQLARRTALVNSKQRQSIKQRVYYNVEKVARLYGKGQGARGALDELASVILQMIAACASAYALGEQADKKYGLRQGRHGRLRRVFTGFDSGLKKLHLDEQEIRRSFEEWTPCFTLICDKESLGSLLGAIDLLRIDASEIVEAAHPLFVELTQLRNEREGIMRELGTVIDSQTAQWRLRQCALVHLQELESIQQQCRAFGKKIDATEQRQVALIGTLSTIGGCKFSKFLPGIEVPLDNILTAATHFEGLRFRAVLTHNTAKSLVTDLTKFLPN